VSPQRDATLTMRSTLSFEGVQVEPLALKGIDGDVVDATSPDYGRAQAKRTTQNVPIARQYRPKAKVFES